MTNMFSGGDGNGKLKIISKDRNDTSQLNVFNQVPNVSIFDVNRDTSVSSKHAKSNNIYKLTFEDRKRFTSHKETFDSLNLRKESNKVISKETSKVQIKQGIMKMRNSRIVNEEMYQFIKSKIMVPVFEKQRKLKIHRRTSSKKMAMNFNNNLNKQESNNDVF